MKKVIYILMIGAGIVSCKKEPLPNLPEGNNPYYTLKGAIGDDAIDFAVGEDNVTISHGIATMNGVETYYGELLAPQNDFIFRVEIIEPEIVLDDLQMIPENINLVHHKAGCMYLDFGSTGSSQANFVLIGNDEGTLIPSSSVTFSEFGIYEKEFQFADYGLETFTIPVAYGFEKPALDAKFITAGSADSITITPNLTDGAHAWYVNDKLVGQEAHYSAPIGNGIYKVEHVVTDSKENTSSYTTLIRIKNDELYWQMNLNYCDTETPISNFGKVKLAVKKDGLWYYSDSQETLTDEFFTAHNLDYIVSSDFTVEKVIFDLALKSKVFTEDGSASIDLSNIEGRFKVGLK